MLKFAWLLVMLAWVFRTNLIDVILLQVFVVACFLSLSIFLHLKLKNTWTNTEQYKLIVLYSVFAFAIQSFVYFPRTVVKDKLPSLQKTGLLKKKHKLEIKQIDLNHTF